MLRIQVYLPDDLYDMVKQRQLPASELLQTAVRGAHRRLQLLAESDRYVAAGGGGRPTPAERARAAAVAGRIAKRAARKAG